MSTKSPRIFAREFKLDLCRPWSLKSSLSEFEEAFVADQARQTANLALASKS